MKPSIAITLLGLFICAPYAQAQNLNSMAQDDPEALSRQLKVEIQKREKDVADAKADLKKLRAAYDKSLTQIEPAAGPKQGPEFDHYLGH